MKSVQHTPIPPDAGASAGEPKGFRSGWIAAAMLLFAPYLLFFFQLGGWGFFDPDEGRYAEVAREMLARHDWVTPTLDYVKFFDKPPLLYWGMAASFSLFGPHEWAARFVPALAALLGLGMTYVLGRRMFGPRAGLLSAIILATSLMWPVMARFVLTDMLVSALVFSALSFWWIGHTAQGTGQTRAFLGFWVMLALGVLAKGPVAVVLAGGTIFLYLLLCGGWKTLTAMKWSIGVPLFMAIAAPWFVLVAHRNPEFNHFFWYEQHIGRFLGHRAIRDHVNGPFYLLEFLPLLFFPWSVFVPMALLAARKRVWPARQPKQRAIVFLGCGCVFITLFFSVSDSKIVTYILPVLPCLAVALAAYFDHLLTGARETGTSGRGLRWSAIFLAFVLAAGGVAGVAFGPKGLRTLGVSGAIAIIIGLMLLLWALALAFMARRGHVSGIVGSVAGGFVVAFTGGLLLITAIAPALTSRPLFDEIQPGLAANAAVVTFSSVHSAAFYAQRRVFVEGAPHELIDGLQNLPPAEKQRWFYSGVAGLRVLLAKPQPVYCIIQKSKKERQQIINALGGEALEITSNARFSLVGNAAALKSTPPLRQGTNQSENSAGPERDGATN